MCLAHPNYFAFPRALPMSSKTKVSLHFLKSFLFSILVFKAFFLGALNKNDVCNSWIQIESPLKKYHLDLEEMAEQVIEDGGSSWKHELLPYNPDSPPSCKTPKSVYHFTFCNDYDFINFKLMETPELRRHWFDFPSCKNACSSRINSDAKNFLFIFNLACAKKECLLPSTAELHCCSRAFCLSCFVEGNRSWNFVISSYKDLLNFEHFLNPMNSGYCNWAYESG